MLPKQVAIMSAASVENLSWAKASLVVAYFVTTTSRQVPVAGIFTKTLKHVSMKIELLPDC